MRLHRRPFHQESYYDFPALRADLRYRESMRLIEDYSLLPFMTPRQYYYPRVVLQFYHSMTSRGSDSPRELQFSIDDRRGVLRVADISAALGLRIPPANAEGYRDWAHPPHREMVRALARDTTDGLVFYRRQLPPQILLIDHLFRTSLFPLQHYVQRRGAILEALYRISEGFWFSPSELVMTSLMHFKEKVHRKDLVRAESIPLLMPRLLCRVLEHMGFPEEPRIEMRVRCPLVMSVERVMTMPVFSTYDHRTRRRYRVRRLRTTAQMIFLSLSPRYRGVQLRSVTSISSSTYHIDSCSRYSRPILFSTPFAGVRSCQLERDSWCDGCHLLTSSYTGSPGSEVGPVPLYASADHDASRPSS